jgi:hypothetical protein
MHRCNDRFFSITSSSLIGEFTEVESGKRNKRPDLEKALALCKRQKGPCTSWTKASRSTTRRRNEFAGERPVRTSSA